MRHDPFAHRKPPAPASGIGHPASAALGLTIATAKRLLSLPHESICFPGGDYNAALRQQVMLELTGTKLAKSKCGATVVRNALDKAANVVITPDSCRAGSDATVEAWLRQLSGVPAPVPWSPPPDEQPSAPQNAVATPPRPAYIPPPPPSFLSKAAPNVLPCLPAGSPIQSDAPASGIRHPASAISSSFTISIVKNPAEKPSFLQAMADAAAAAIIGDALVPQPGTWIPPHRRRPNH